MATILYPSRIKKDNLGDILINVLLIRELSKKNKVYLDSPDKTLIELSRNNNPFSENINYIGKTLSFKGYPIVRWINALHIISSLNLVFDPPGAYSIKYSGLKAFLKRKKYILRALLLKIFKIKNVRVGVSYGEIESTSLKDEIVLSKLYKSIAIRSIDNYNYLKNLGLENIELIGDLAYLFDSNHFKFEESLGTKLDNNYIIISFRWALYGHIKNEQYFNSLRRALLELIALNDLNQDRTYVFSYQVEEDYEAICILKEDFEKAGYKINLIEKKLDFNSAISLYKNAELIFSNRLHVVLWGLLNGSNSYVLTDCEKHKKIVSIFKDLDLSNILFDIQQNHKDSFINREKNTLEKFKKIATKKRIENIRYIEELTY